MGKALSETSIKLMPPLVAIRPFRWADCLFNSYSDLEIMCICLYFFGKLLTSVTRSKHIHHSPLREIIKVTECIEIFKDFLHVLSWHSLLGLVWYAVAKISYGGALNKRLFCLLKDRSVGECFLRRDMS